MEWLVAIAGIIAVMCAVGYFTRAPEQTFSARMSEIGDQLSKAGDRMSAIGLGLTLAITVPIAGLLFFGWVGLGVGLLIAFAFAGSAFRRAA